MRLPRVGNSKRTKSEIFGITQSLKRKGNVAKNDFLTDLDYR
jgi:hypothetical protein